MYLPDAVPKAGDPHNQYLDEAKKFLPKEFQKSSLESLQEGGEGPNRKFEKWFNKEMQETQQVEALS